MAILFDNATKSTSTAEPCRCHVDHGVKTGPHPSEWPAWVDDHVWTLSPEFREIPDGPVPDGDDDHLLNVHYEPTAEDLEEYAAWSAELDERLTMGELLERQVEAFKAWGNALGDLLAAHNAELVRLARICDASSPAELADRLELLATEF